jgi:sugar/nucleoside kinase (ribokinase family)
MPPTIGLLGTITYDHITTEDNPEIQGLGGVLYQAAALCGLDQSVSLFTTVGQELVPQVRRTTEAWRTLQTERWAVVPGPGNRVFLHYPSEGERREVLANVVPDLDPANLLSDLTSLCFLVLALNSGYDISLENWRRIVRAAGCPVWLDIHSLALSKELNTPRSYRPLPEWKAWAQDVDYVQANSAEVACMLGKPGSSIERENLEEMARQAFRIGVKTLFITLGSRGVQVLTPHGHRLVPTRTAESVADTTGCGDVLCAGTVARLLAGDDPFTAAAFGARLATDAVEVVGVNKTFSLIRGRSG